MDEQHEVTEAAPAPVREAFRALDAGSRERRPAALPRFCPPG
ncbi:hypothetical protein [Nonomuraea sp. NPDC050643]